jgi:predicted nucleic acid-binding protein
VVIDANLAAALVLPLPYSDQASDKIFSWKRSRTELYAPLLIEYEIAAILRKAVVAGWLTTTVTTEALQQIWALNIVCQAPTLELHQQALDWAERLGHSKTYDAHYLALADHLRLDFWTADRRLANGTQQAGVTWVYWIGDRTN